LNTSRAWKENPIGGMYTSHNSPSLPTLRKGGARQCAGLAALCLAAKTAVASIVVLIPSRGLISSLHVGLETNLICVCLYGRMDESSRPVKPSDFMPLRCAVQLRVQPSFGVSPSHRAEQISASLRDLDNHLSYTGTACDACCSVGYTYGDMKLV
jgi:hypothetical protein